MFARTIVSLSFYTEVTKLNDLIGLACWRVFGRYCKYCHPEGRTWNTDYFQVIMVSMILLVRSWSACS
jgi:hypothetical protein